MSDLNRTVPFLETAGPDAVIVLDRFAFPPSSLTAQHPLVTKLGASLSLNAFGDVLSASEGIAIATEQYLAGSEFVYGHPIWQDIRTGSQAAVHAYLLETRHYLAAASSRMSPGVHAGVGLDPLTLLLSKHLIEEYDHACFFEDALNIIGCAREVVRFARPLPSTLEWIHFTRAVAQRDPLAAALCSGFMEFSSRESAAVLEWHRQLVALKLIPEDANTAIFRHVETDLGFGHDKNWEYAIRDVAPISTQRFAAALDDVAGLCEMIYRWLSALRDGVSPYIVAAMSAGCVGRPEGEQTAICVRAFNGFPVWSSSVLSAVNHGGDFGDAMARTVIAAAYSHGEAAVGPRTEIAAAIESTCSSLSAPEVRHAPDVADVNNLARSWLRSIDGHDLWTALVDQGSSSLVQGFILENYHYLASATRHISAAIASCPDGAIQLELIRHVEDELEHCELLRKVLEETTEVRDVRRCRPLPTTVAFVGYLRDLAMADWRGYLIASAFLQSSLAECRPTNSHHRFYEAVIKANPNARELLNPLRRHDDIDNDLGHDDHARTRVEKLVQRHRISGESIQRAAMTPMLAWGFLDGILHHYKHGGAAISQRVGWEA